MSLSQALNQFAQNLGRYRYQTAIFRNFELMSQNQNSSYFLLVVNTTIHLTTNLSDAIGIASRLYSG